LVTISAAMPFVRDGRLRMLAVVAVIMRFR
jgi:hypothetical protein